MTFRHAALLALLVAAPLAAQPDFRPRGPLLELHDDCALEPVLLNPGSGSQHAALWYAFSSESGIYVRHWNGPQPTGGNGFRIVEGNIQALAAAPNPDGFLVVWVVENQLRFQIFQTSPLEPTHAVVEVAPSSDRPALAYGPDGGFTLAWRTEDGGIAARRFASTGVPTTPVIDVAAPNFLFTPRLAMSDAGFLVGWNFVSPVTIDYPLQVRAFDPTGRPLGGQVDLGVGNAVALAANAAGYVVAHLDEQVYTRLLGPDGQPLAAASPLGFYSSAFRLMPTADGTLFVHQIERAIFASLLDDAGLPTAPSTLLVPDPGYAPLLSSLQNETDGFHIAWSEASEFPIPIPCATGVAAFGQDFGPAGYLDVPALSARGAAALALLLALAGAWALRRAG